jgi:hypothetical protein
LGILLILGCSVGTDSGSLILSNGTIVTAADQQFLENLRPEFNTLVASVAGPEGGKALSAGGDAVIPEGTSEELVAQIEAFMKDKIGEGYEKYIIQGTYGEPQEIQVGGPEANASWIGIPAGSDPAYVYYMMVNATWTTYPWGSLNWADTAFDKRLISTGSPYKINAYYMRSYVQDPVTPSGKWAAAYGAHIVTIGGNLRGGFFPPPALNPITTHEITDPRVTNGYQSRTFQWYWGS